MKKIYLGLIALLSIFTACSDVELPSSASDSVDTVSNLVADYTEGSRAVTLSLNNPAGEVSRRFFGTKKANSSEIYTIIRTDVVDLGQTVDERKIVWKTTNETGAKDGQGTQHNKNVSGYTNEWYYDWETAKAFGRLDNDNGYENIIRA